MADKDAKTTNRLTQADLENFVAVLTDLNRSDAHHFQGFVTVENWQGEEVIAEVKYDRNEADHYLTF